MLTPEEKSGLIQEVIMAVEYAHITDPKRHNPPTADLLFSLAFMDDTDFILLCNELNIKTT